MSIELCNPPTEYPKEWHVRPTICDCHPENCSCPKWSVYSPKGNRKYILPDKSMAEDIVSMKKKLRNYKSLKKLWKAARERRTPDKAKLSEISDILHLAG